MLCIRASFPFSFNGYVSQPPHGIKANKFYTFGSLLVLLLPFFTLLLGGSHGSIEWRRNFEFLSCYLHSLKNPFFLLCKARKLLQQLNFSFREERKKKREKLQSEFNFFSLTANSLLQRMVEALSFFVNLWHAWLFTALVGGGEKNFDGNLYASEAWKRKGMLEATGRKFFADQRIKVNFYCSSGKLHHKYFCRFCIYK